MSKMEILHLELTFTLNVSFRLRCISGATDTDWLMLDISVALGPEWVLSDAHNGPRCGDAGQVCNGLLLGEVTLLILAQIKCSKAQS